MLDDDPTAPVRDHRHVALARTLGLWVGRDQVGARGDRAQHHALLGHRQRGAEAAPDAAAERDPRVRAGLVVEEPLGAEGVGLGVTSERWWSATMLTATGRARGNDVLAEPPAAA